MLKSITYPNDSGKGEDRQGLIAFLAYQFDGAAEGIRTPDPRITKSLTGITQLYTR
jgi:hypothetical protein